MSTSTSRELTIRALESEPHTFYHDSLLQHLSYHFGIAKDAQGHALKCLLSLLILKESQDGATLESAHFELQHDEYSVVVSFYMATPSLSHGDEDHDPSTDLSQGGGEMMRSILRASPWALHLHRKY